MNHKATFLLLFIAAPLLAGFVAPTEKILENTVVGRIETASRINVVLGARSGYLYMAGPGLHALVFDDLEVYDRPGTAFYPQWKPLFRLLDLYTAASVEEAALRLAAAGIDPSLRGFVRLGEDRRTVGVTLGARGETDPDLPRLVVDEELDRVVSLRLSEFNELLCFGRDGQKLPGRIELGEETYLFLVGEPEPVDELPYPLIETPPPKSDDEEDRQMPDWRKAFQQ